MKQNERKPHKFCYLALIFRNDKKLYEAGKLKHWLWWSWMTLVFCVAISCLSIMVLHKSALCDQQVELILCEVWKPWPLRLRKEKKNERKKAGLCICIEQMEYLSSICMKQTAASLSPCPLLRGCDLRTQWK